jgi:nickel-dependent lactate racemase
MSAFERVLQGVKQVLLVAEDVKRLAESVKVLGIEVREIDRRLARLEGVVAVTATTSPRTARRRLMKKDGERVK